MRIPRFAFFTFEKACNCNLLQLVYCILFQLGLEFESQQDGTPQLNSTLFDIKTKDSLVNIRTVR